MSLHAYPRNHSSCQNRSAPIDVQRVYEYKDRTKLVLDEYSIKLTKVFLLVNFATDDEN